jgi:Bacteroides conjugative transposon TraM protein
MSNQQNNDTKPKLGNEQKQKMKKYAVFALMFIVFAACLWLIFAPSEEDRAKEEANVGYNSEIPMPKEEGIIGDKKSAYEQEQIKQKQAERMRSLNDFSQLLSEETGKSSVDLALIDDEPSKPKTSTNTSPIQNSVSAYRDINRNLGSFYETPREDPEKKRLEAELEELKSRLDERENRQNAVDEQMALMEKSFQMASKYMPQTQQSQSSFPVQNTEEQVVVANAQPTRNKTAVTSISQVRERTVSALQQNISNEDFKEAYSKPRNFGFFTATAEMQAEIKNTINACIHDDQTVLDGQSVRLRLLETMNAGNIQIPRNSVITGMGKIQGERLDWQTGCKIGSY